MICFVIMQTCGMSCVVVVIVLSLISLGSSVNPGAQIRLSQGALDYGKSGLQGETTPNMLNSTLVLNV